MHEYHPSADSLEPARMDGGGGRVRDAHKVDDQRTGHTSNGAGAGNIFKHIYGKISSILFNSILFKNNLGYL